MSRHRVLLVTAAAVLAVLGGAAWTTVLHGDLVTYRHQLVTYDDQAPATRVVDLEGSAAAVAIGSPDGRSLSVQWRDGDGGGWTRPRSVFALDGPPRLDLSDTTAREEAGTVALLAVFSDGDDDDADDLVVGLACRDLECAVQESPGFGGEPAVTADGAWAYLGEDPRGAWLWDVEEGIRRLEWSGHPPYRSSRVTASQPALAPDGSLRVVEARVVPGGCRLSLLVSGPGDAALQQVAGATRPRGGPADSRCRPFLDAPSVGTVRVLPVDPGHRRFTWRRDDGGEWSTHPPTDRRSPG